MSLNPDPTKTKRRCPRRHLHLHPPQVPQVPPSPSPKARRTRTRTQQQQQTQTQRRRQRNQMEFFHRQAQLAYHPPVQPLPRLPVAAAATTAAVQAETKPETEAGHHKSRRRQLITHRPPLRLQSRSPSQEPSFFSPAGSHYTTASSSPPKKNELGRPRPPHGPGTKMDVHPAWLQLKRRSLHALCSVGRLSLIAMMMMMICTTRVASRKKSWLSHRCILLIIPLRRTHQSRANERANLACSRESSIPVLVPVLARTLPHPHPHHHIVRFGIDAIPSGVARGAAMITPTPTAAVVVAPSGVRYLSPPVTRRSSHWPRLQRPLRL